MAGALGAVAVGVVTVAGSGASGPVASADTTSTTSTTTVATSTTASSTTTSTTTPPSSTTSSTTTVPTTTTTTVPAEQVLAEALVAVQGQRAVEWGYKLAEGTESFTKSVHAGMSDGTMVDTLHFKQSGTVKFTLHNRLYMQGNAYGLAEDLGFKSKFASTEAGKWFSASGASSYFADQAVLMTMTGVAGLLTLPAAKLTVLAPTKIAGVATIPVQEAATLQGARFTQTLYVKETGNHLPVEIIRELNGLEAVFSFKNWGVPPDALAPSHAVVFKSQWLTKT